MTQIHIDTDMGVDDGLALVLANGLFGPSLVAVSTVYGNVPVDVATRNALLFRNLIRSERHFDIYVGADSASDGFFRDARHIHGDDGLGNVTKTLPAEVLRAIDINRDAKPLAALQPPRDGSEKITIIGLGPATNVPALIECYGPANIDRVVLMCGVFLDNGNITPTAEFNAHCDPSALKETLATGVPVTLVPLDVCRKIQLARTTVRNYAQQSGTTLAALIVDSHMTYMNFYQQWDGIDGCYPHDSTAVFVAAKPELFFHIPARIDVDTSSERRGTTSFDFDNSAQVSIVFGGHLKELRRRLEHFPA